MKRLWGIRHVRYFFAAWTFWDSWLVEGHRVTDAKYMTDTVDRLEFGRKRLEDIWRGTA